MKRQLSVKGRKWAAGSDWLLERSNLLNRRNLHRGWLETCMIDQLGRWVGELDILIERWVLPWPLLILLWGPRWMGPGRLFSFLSSPFKSFSSTLSVDFSSRFFEVDSTTPLVWVAGRHCTSICFTTISAICFRSSSWLSPIRFSAQSFTSMITWRGRERVLAAVLVLMLTSWPSLPTTASREQISSPPNISDTWALILWFNFGQYQLLTFLKFQIEPPPPRSVKSQILLFVLQTLHLVNPESVLVLDRHLLQDGLTHAGLPVATQWFPPTVTAVRCAVGEFLLFRPPD